MSEATLIASTAKLTRPQLAAVPTPMGTATHRPVPHVEVVEALVETLSFRHIGVVTEEYAVSKDGMKMFGVLDLDTPACPVAGSRSASATATTEACAWPP